MAKQGVEKMKMPIPKEAIGKIIAELNEIIREYWR
jgi:hypothetical protein